MVPPSGNLWIGGQQIWIGPALSGRQVTLWADAMSLHVLLDGTRIKTLPSRLGAAELARLAASGARPAGPSPLPAGDGAVIEVDRTVNATGSVSLGDQQAGVGLPLTGQRVTLRMEGPLMAVLSHDGSLLRILACPIPADRRWRLRGARRGRPLRPHPAGPSPCSGGSPAAAPSWPPAKRSTPQNIHAGKTATVICENNHFRVVIDGETTAVVPRTTTSEIHRCKANPPTSAPRPGLPPKDSDPHAPTEARCADAAELAEMLQFLSQWLAQDPAASAHRWHSSPATPPTA